MKTFQHILVPIDFEVASRAAIELAASLARPFRANVTLLHVWEIPIYPYMDFMLNSELISRVEDAAAQGLNHALQTLQEDLPNAKSLLRHGRASATILEAIDDLEVDLVVMGTHGRHGVGHVVLGSIAEKIVRSSAVPVLTVHASAGHPESEP